MKTIIMMGNLEGWVMGCVGLGLALVLAVVVFGGLCAWALKGGSKEEPRE